MNATLISDGDAALELSEERLFAHLERVAGEWILGPGARRLLLLPPDHTRLHSRAGPIVDWLWDRLHEAVDIEVMPTLGTHAAMTEAEWSLMFRHVPYDRMTVHRWRQELVTLGEISAEEMRTLSNGCFAQPLRVEINRRIVSGEYDLILSIGQVVPHEVIGLANYTKNVCIGAGGKELIHKSHFLGALCGMESIMGQQTNPVRTAIDTAFDRFIRPKANVKFLLTVVEDTEDGDLLRGFFAGCGDACFTAACDLSREVNITWLDQPFDKCVVYLDPREFKSTWLGNKAIYRTRMAMADGGELQVLAPGVRMFGEDDEIDRLIRAYGYRGTSATLEAVEHDATLGDNLSAAAHLIHGSSEGRFAITYCTGDGLSKEEIEAAGYRHRGFAEVASELQLDEASSGWNRALDGSDYYLIRNPALGLWAVR